MPAYEPKNTEPAIYDLWEKSGFFNPDNLPGDRKKTYSISLPPPNITGALHMGHALNGTIQDILIRYNRMKGLKTLWMPGIDHAGIATQNKVEKKLKKEGKRRKDMSREEFEAEVWKWKEEYGDTIVNQMKTMGFSCDWSRARFTMDEEYTKSVKEAFIHYYEKGLIYRGPRIVNWCPRCETAISDIEIKHRDEKGSLWYIKYPIKDSNDFITVATTRPETMIGDAAIAVHPKDERYKDLVGKTVILPIVNKEIPVVADRLVEKDFGTGAVKITPAHDMLDNAIAKNHDLPVINIITTTGRMAENTGEFAGMGLKEAREVIVEKLKEQNLLEKTEDMEHALSICERCETTIEPLISTQWFLKMKELAKPAIKVVEKNKVKFTPERYKKVYLDWMEKLEDWCISRQLWWGHRLPVYFCQTIQDSRFKIQDSKTNKTEHNVNYVVSKKKPSRCPICGECDMKQSDDVLDTWFSSALWPFAGLGWPTDSQLTTHNSQPTNDHQSTKHTDLKLYYPNNFLSTAQEILYLWVARMIFSGMEFAKDIPFDDVYINPTVLNLKGQRMSKSLGTGIDPLELVEKYGTDALRFGITAQTSREQQSFKFAEEYVLAGKKFANKLWNIKNFIEILEGDAKDAKNKENSISDKWILSRLHATIKEAEENIETLNFDKAQDAVYEFTWHEFADWYIEINKIPEFQNIPLLKEIFKNILTLLHPFIPFITEELWRTSKNTTEILNQVQNDDGEGDNERQMLIVSKWPEFNKNLLDKKSEEEISKLQELILDSRKKRMDEQIPSGEPLKINLPEDKKELEKYKDVILKMAKTNVE